VRKTDVDKAVKAPLEYWKKQKYLEAARNCKAG
jgi:hypothetical protein